MEFLPNRPSHSVWQKPLMDKPPCPTDNGSESGGRSITVIAVERTRLGTRLGWVRLGKYTGAGLPKASQIMVRVCHHIGEA